MAMKKNTYLHILVFSFFLFTLSAAGQQFHGGVMAGIAATQVAGDRFSGFDKAGLFGGGFVNLQVTPRSAFQMELEFFQKGSRKNPDAENNDYDSYLFRTSYVELPFLYQYIISDRFRVEAGPSGGFLLGYYEERDELVISDEPGQNKPSAATLQINVGLYVYFTENIALNVRTHNSVLNIRKENSTGDVYRFFDYGQYHDALVLSFFYIIRKKGG